ncbi:MAG: hypothetical protein E7261_06710 [Lachnospiraceae bacterium]|nr:hypothetical protein [Lachnospiraceae bacterium]
MKKKFSIGTGVPSILMIFVVLALTTFAVLSFTSARADYKLTEKNCKYIMDYYNADKEAQTIIASLDAIIAEKNSASANYDLAGKVVALGKDISIETDNDGKLLLKYKVPVNEKQYLNVWLKVNEAGSKNRYSITKYSVTQQVSDSGIEFEDESAGWWQGN